MINANIVGNLGKDAELRTTSGGKVVCGFSVASTGRDKATTWVRCSVWGARGEKLSGYLTKGTKVAVSGTLSTREHDGKTYLELDVAELELCGGGQRKDEAPQPARSSGRGHQQNFADDGGDLPF
jgi:single-strand DNA-binding protein